MSKWRISKRFLLTYLSFFIGLILLFIPLYYLVTSLFAKSFLNTSMHVLETGINNIESDLSSINTTVQDIYINPDIKRVAYITPPLSIDDYYRTNVAVTDFGRSITKNSIISDCGLIFPNNMILTPQRIHYQSDDFYDYYFYDNTIEDYEKWKQSLIENGNISKFSPVHSITTYDHRTYEAMTLIIKLPTASSSYHSLFYATIDKNYLISRFATQEMLDYGLLYIHDMNGVLLLAQENNKADDLSYIDKVSENLGLHVTVGIRSAFFAQKLQPLRNIVIVFFVAYILLGLIMSCFFAYGTSRPLRNIIDTAITISSNHFHTMEPDKISSEFKFIMNFLNKADCTFQNYEQVLLQQEELLRSNLFERLIRGNVCTSSDLDRAHLYFSDFPEQYCIANLFLSDLGTFELSSLAARQTLLLSIIKPRLPTRALIHFTSNVVLLLLPYGTTDNDKHCMEKLLLDIKGELFKNADVSSCITISDVFFKIEDMHIAFYQAHHLLRLIGSAPADKIYRKDEYPISNLSLTLGYFESNRFYELIIKTEKEQAINIVNTTRNTIKVIGYVDENEIQQVFYSYRRLFIRLKNELPEKYGSLILLPVYDGKIDIDSLFNCIENCVNIACDCIIRQHTDEREIFEQSILTYINCNLHNNDLYIKSVTCNFSISENILQGIMHKFTNTSFFDYVENRRMEKAQNLIKYTSDPFSKLAEECGYSTLNSFYKAFRRHFGISPSEMRKGQAI